MFTSKVLALENAQVSRYFTYTPSTAGFQPLLSNSSCNSSKCAFASVSTNTVEDQTLDAIPAQCSGGEVPKSSLPLPSCTGATASGAARTGTRYRQKQAWPDWQVRGTLELWIVLIFNIFTIFCRCGSLVRMCESAVRAKRSLAWHLPRLTAGTTRSAFYLMYNGVFVLQSHALRSKKVCLNRFNKSVPNILVCI